MIRSPECGEKAKGDKGLYKEEKAVVNESEQDLEAEDAEEAKDLVLAVRLIGEERRKERLEREKERMMAEGREDIGREGGIWEKTEEITESLAREKSREK